jgi:hypothetical protein
MKDTHATGGSRPFGISVAAAILAPPRETKRLNHGDSRCRGDPYRALGAAPGLRFDRLDPALDRTLAYFLVAAASVVLFLGVWPVPR